MRRISSAQGVFIEMFITAALCLSVLMLGAEKHQATPFAPVGVGLTLFACHMWAVFYTGAAMNSARSFGPAAVTGFKDSQHWIVSGPVHTLEPLAHVSCTRSTGSARRSARSSPRASTSL